MDEFSFCISLAKLVNTQNQEVELAVAGSGEFKIREKFKFIEVSPDKWGSMQDGQRIKALEKVHTVTLEQSSASLADHISNIFNSRRNHSCKSSFVVASIGYHVHFYLPWLARQLV